MNKIFKVIWNPATGNYTVTSETAKSRGKKSGRSKLLISALVAGGLLSSFGALADNYDGQGVDYGDGSASDGWVAIGKGAKANIFLNNAGASTALGYDAIAEGQYSSAIGSKTHAIGGASMAFGVSAISEGDRSIALGASSYSFGQYSMALGRYSKALGRLSIAMGDSSKADGANAIALGNAAKAAGIMSIGLGDNANASQDYAMALGAESEAAENATAIGNKAHAKGVNSIALGNGSQALADSAIAIGQGNKANGADAIALGNGSQSSGLNAIALGKASVVTGDNSLALGSNTNANGINSVALGAGSIADQDDSVSVGSDSLQRKIVNVKNGTIKADSHDAINGSQLYAISDSVAKRLGGGSSVNVDDGTVKAPTYNLKNGNKNNVGDALTVLDQFTLQWDQNRDKYSAAHGSSTASVITDVADGAVSDSSKDAVNGSQLKATNDDVETNTTNIATNTGNIATNTANIATNTTNITNLTDTVGDLKDDALLWNGTAFNAAHGTETTSTITNVKAGTLSDDSTDAVNGSQLKDTNDNVATNTTNIASNTANIATNTSNIADNTANIATNTSNIADNTANIATNTSNIAGNTANIATNTTNIAANTTSINSLNTSVDALEQDAMLWNGTAFNAAHGTETTSTITNVKAGTLSDDSTDAVNGSQLKATNDNVATNTTNIASNTANIATNTANINTLNTSIDTLEQDAILWNGTAYSAAHGTETASTITNVKAGTLSENSTDAVNGAQLNATNANVATNTTNIATNTASINTLNTSIDALEQDALLWDGTAFSAAHGANKDASKITNVLAGTVSSASTDAINGSQLHGLSSSIATYLGGGATVSDSGVFSGPTYNIDGNDYTNVGAALDAINTSLSDSLGDALLWDSTTGAFSAKHGSTASVITNVADGAVSDSSSDAVNGSQLYDVSNSVVDVLGGGAGVNTDGSISAPTYTIANTDYDNVGDALNALDTTLDDAMLWDATAGENGAFSASHDGSASKITNVAAGTISDTSTDAVNGAQLHGVSSSVAEALGGGAAVNSDGSISAPTYTIADTDYTNVGDAMNAIDSTLDNALLWDAAAGENGAFNASHDGKASVITNVANGQINETSTDAVNGSQLNATNMLIQNIAGDTSESYITENGEGINYVRTNDSGLVFEDASATGVGATAVGYNSVASGDSSVAIGQNSSSTIESGIALGSSSVSNRVILQGSRDTSVTEDGVVIGYNTSDGELLGALSIGDDGKYRPIINVAAGSADTDAVNVGQLKVTDERVTQNTQSITNLNNQVTNLDTRVTNIENGIGDIVTTGSTKYFKTNTDGVDASAQGKDSVAIGSGSIAAADNSVALGTGSVATEENTISVGSSTNQRRITNVAAGKNATDAVNVAQLKSSEAGGVRYDTKADGSIDYSNITLGGGNGGTTRISNVSAGVNNNDAVNYAQLKQSVQETKQYTDQRMVEMDNKLSKTESKLSGGIASAMAMTGLPQAYTPGASMASIGGGTYNGESAVALGVSMVSANGRWVYKLQGSTNSQGEYSAALGAGIQW
ncbi:YadA-like family protein [Escherichia coli]|uniref:YadA-like family protein n=1 Tax=Escherichia coli TaxID=562 RepID=UPI003F620DAB